MTATTPPPAAEFLASVAGWLFTLSHRYARRLGLDRDDVFQSVAAELVRRVHMHDPARSNRSTFTALVARQVAFKMAEREARHRVPVRLDWPAADGEVIEVPGHEPDPLDTVSGKDLARVALAAVAELPDVQRAAVAVRFGFTNGDADSVRAAAGLKRLRTTLGGSS